MLTDYSGAFILAMALVFTTFIFNRLLPASANPVLAHNISWAVALGVYSLHWIAYVDVASFAWIVIVVGIMGFNLGALVVVTSRAGRKQVAALATSSLAWATWALPALFLLGVALYLRALDGSVGLSALWQGASTVRTFQGTDNFGVVFPIYGRLLFFLGPLVFVVYANPWLSHIRVSRATRLVVLVVTTAGLALALGRTLLLVALVWQAAIVYLRPRRRTAQHRFRRAVAIGALGVTTVFAFQVLAVVTGKTGAQDIRIQPYVRGPLDTAAGTSLVTYSSGGIPALSTLVSDPPDRFAFGMATAGPLAKAVPTLDPPEQVGEFALVPFPHNAYTWLDTYFRDFGFVGVAILPFLMGIVVAGLCRVRFATSEDVLIGSLMLGLCLWAPLVNHFPSTFTWEFVAILAVSRVRARGRASRGSASKVDRRRYGPSRTFPPVSGSRRPSPVARWT